MKWIVTSVAGVVVFAAGFATSVFVGEDGESARIETVREAPAVNEEEPVAFTPRRSADEAGNDDLADALRRIGELEAQLRERDEAQEVAERTIDEQRSEIEQLQKDLEEAAKDGPPDGNNLDKGPAAVAGILGLDSSRTQALETAWNRMQDARKDLERRHAEITVEGDRTTIHIPPHAEEWDAVIANFDDDIGRILTPAERDRYGELGLQRNLIDGPFGHADRTIELGPHENGYQAKESAKSGSSTTVSNGIWGGEDGQKEATAAYRHLLDG